MLKKLLLVVLFCSSVFAKLTAIDEVQLQQMMKKGVVVIDIRRDDEFKKYGIIKGAKMLTFFDEKGKYDIPKWLSKFVQFVKTKQQPFVLYCAHANRTKMVGNFLDQQLKYENVYHLKGGIMYGWIDKGMKTVRVK